MRSASVNRSAAVGPSTGVPGNFRQLARIGAEHGDVRWARQNRPPVEHGAVVTHHQYFGGTHQHSLPPP
jgi:hypothetical protein